MAKVVTTEYPTNHRCIDYSGEEINGIKLLRWIGKDKGNCSVYECRCHCGNLFTATLTDLRQSKVKSCGCLKYRRIDDHYLTYIGKKINRLKIIGFFREEKPPRTYGYFRCICDCGKQVSMRACDVIYERVLSCGCEKERKKDIERMSHIGEVHNHLKIIDYVKKEECGIMRKFYKCECTCGNIVDIRCHFVLNGQNVSCGCCNNNGNYKVKGLSNTPLYKVWAAMKDRCYNPNNQNYHSYGGRGIRICDDWLIYNSKTKTNDGFLNFYNWAMNNGYSKGLSIDRIDVDGNYDPNNCQWTTMNKQGKNRRNSKYITYTQYFEMVDAKPISYTLPLLIWSKITGLSKSTITKRLVEDREKWTVEQALTTRVRSDKRSDLIILNIGPYIEYNRPDFYESSIHD